jgi:membrane protein required for colicin V production
MLSNTMDVVIAIMLIVGAVRGYRRGFLVSLLSVLALILGVIGAYSLLQWGMSLLLEYFQIHGKILPYVSFLLLFVAIVALVHVAGRFLKKAIDLTPLGVADNAAGSVLGLVSWCFALSFLLWMAVTYENAFVMRWKDKSLFYPYLAAFAPKVVGWFSVILPFAGNLFDQMRELLEVSER